MRAWHGRSPGAADQAARTARAQAVAVMTAQARRGILVLAWWTVTVAVWSGPLTAALWLAAILLALTLVVLVAGRVIP